jgi:hypothetical protein
VDKMDIKQNKGAKAGAVIANNSNVVAIPELFINCVIGV